MRPLSTFYRQLLRLLVVALAAAPTASIAHPDSKKQHHHAPTSAPASRPATAPSSQPTTSQPTARPRQPASMPVRSAPPRSTAPADAKHGHSHAHSHAHAHEHGSGHAHDGDDKQMRTVVHGKRPQIAASASVVGHRDVRLRVAHRPADVLQVTPGLYVAQHAGGGKANQYFLRGFDIDHGTDLALFVDGIPVNMVSHGHGQGYADLNWLIPETVQRMEVFKGPYYARYGDFATAGAINLVTKTRFAVNSITATGGMFETWRGVAALSPKIDGIKPLFAAEVYGTNGPFENRERLKRYSLLAKLTRVLDSGALLSVGATAYGSGWYASGQIPDRAVSAGTLDRFGTLDPTEGGNSQRFSLFGSYRRIGANADVALSAYLVQYRLTLYSNFTFFSRDAQNGDQIEQNDARWLFGLAGHYRFYRTLWGMRFDTTFGLQVRSDVIDNDLSYDRQRERLRTVVDASVLEASISLYARERITFTPWLAALLGVRGDYFGFSVDDHLEDRGSTGSKTSGVRQALRVSPKASLVFSPHRTTDIFANFGVGFHSNDARGVVLGQGTVSPLARAIGYELGARTQLFGRLAVSAAFFVMHLQSEIVWIGDEGRTEASGASRRLGGELSAKLQLLRWLSIDADVTLSDARFVDAPADQDRVPLAPRLLLRSGVSASHPWGIFGRLSLVHLAKRPANEDGSIEAKGFVRLDATVGYRHKRFAIEIAVQNALNTAWNEAQFATTSRLAGEAGPAACRGTRAVLESGRFVGCDDLHFTPGWPINVRASATLYL
ncbi:MAG: TonB-dependent receptor [Myxococcales bacterium]|nr:TonB-dependent receptor [Myxococcales bacterium]